MNNDVNTTQRQIQEQKVRFNGGGTHWIGEAIKYGFLLLLLVVGIMVFLWVFGGDNGRNTDLGVGFVVAAAALWWLYHGSRWVKHKADKAEIDSHFHDVSDILTIGDTFTHDFTPFYVPQFQEVKEEYTEQDSEPPDYNPYAKPILTMSQSREKQIQTYYEEGKTMQEIVKLMEHSAVFEPPSMYDVRKALGKTGKEKQDDTTR